MLFCCGSECCFELFGFDVLIDQVLQPWLMEVNFAPSLTADSELDYFVKSKVLTDMLNLIGLRNSNNANNNNVNNNTSSKTSNNRKAPPTNNNSNNNSNTTNSTDEVVFHFHHDYHHRDQYPTQQEEEEANNDFNYFASNPIEKVIALQFREELSLSNEKKLLLNFIQERIRHDKVHSGFKLIYPMQERYCQYAKFFSMERNSNEIIGRFMFFHYWYHSLTTSSDESSKKLSKTKQKNISKTKQKLITHTIYSQQFAGLYHPANGATAKASSRPTSAQIHSHPTPRQDDSTPSSCYTTPREASEDKEKSEMSLNVEIWNQIHNRWARSMGRSTQKHSK